MSRELLLTNSFSSVAAGSTATLELPVGEFTYHSLQLLYGTTTVGGPNEANMRAEVNEVRIIIAGKVQRVFSAAELFDALNGPNGIVVSDGFLPIFFSEPWRRSVNGEEALAWGTNDIPPIFIEVDIDAAATNPTLSARIEVDRTRRNLGPIKKVRRFTVPAAAVGLHNLTTLPRIDAYQRLHAFSTVIDDIRIVLDGSDVWDLTDGQARELYQQKGFTDIAAVTSVMFDHTQRAADVQEMRLVLPNGRGVKQRSEFRIDFNMSAATPFTLLTESIGFRD